MQNIKIRFIFFSVILISTGFLSAGDTHELSTEINNLKQNDPYISLRLNIKDPGINKLLDSVQSSKLLAEAKDCKFLKKILLGSSQDVAKSMSKKGLIAVDVNQAPKLHAVVQSISDKLKMPKPFIFVVFDKKLFNAAAFSFSKSASLIFIGEKLLNDMNDEQIEAILAHELGHVYHNHVPKRLGLMLLGVIGGGAFVFAEFLFLDKHFKLSDIEKFGIVYVSAILLSILPVYLMFKYFRDQEREADDIAIKIAGAGKFTESMEQFKDYYLNKLEEFDEEYTFLQQEIEALEKVSPESAAQLKVSANTYNAIINASYQGIIETGALTHPAMNERIETGNKAQEQEVCVVAA